ncbi:MAG TPA: hypothetical protein VGM60_20885 [Pseudonocardia sp.]|jgi:hypothetical protein|uniref:hypothetical protein n=1 Tax=Pseudonocardia sp. TaxID=60912 RepID=UPI002F40CD76
MTPPSHALRAQPDPTAHWRRLRAVEDFALAEQNRKAVQVVAGQASDRDDCVELLAMLGLDARGCR